jgi:simple sugar transport system substrate-binding protein
MHMQMISKKAKWKLVAGVTVMPMIGLAGCSSSKPAAAPTVAETKAADTAAADTKAADTAAADTKVADTAAADTKAADTTAVVLTAGGGLPSGLGSRGKNRNVTFIMDNPPSDPFWGTIQQGAKDAAALYNITLDIQFTDGAKIQDYNDKIGAAIASKPAGIGVVVRDPDTLTENICAAAKAGIAVMSYNITQGGAVGDCMQGFIGQDFPAAGYLIGKRMIAEGKIGKGDLVLLPVEQPDASYAKERGQGVKKALDEVGAKYEVIQAGATGDAEALENMTKWLVANPTVKMILPMGGTPHRNALPAIADANLSDKGIIIGGFDISKPITDGIKAGTIKAAVTQEPYIQGFQTVAELALLIDFGIHPFSINTGAGIVDSTNVAIVEELAGTIR